MLIIIDNYFNRTYYTYLYVYYIHCILLFKISIYLYVYIYKNIKFNKVHNIIDHIHFHIHIYYQLTEFKTFEFRCLEIPNF